jgi:hypothetical protein
MFVSKSVPSLDTPSVIAHLFALIGRKVQSSGDNRATFRSAVFRPPRKLRMCIGESLDCLVNVLAVINADSPILKGLYAFSAAARISGFVFVS